MKYTCFTKADGVINSDTTWANSISYGLYKKSSNVINLQNHGPILLFVCLFICFAVMLLAELQGISGSFVDNNGSGPQFYEVIAC